MKINFDNFGGRKTVAFFLCYISVNAGFFLGKDVMVLTGALSSFVALLTVGNLSEHKIKTKPFE